MSARPRTTYATKPVKRKRSADSLKSKPSGLPLPKKHVYTKKELWALYDLNRPSKPRYEGLKGVYWYVLSVFVRKRDLTMWGRCISCNKVVTSIDELQAGHFIAAGTGGWALLFDLRNINGECGYCNGFDNNHLVGYEVGLDDRYGVGTAQQLKDEYVAGRKVGAPKIPTWSDAEYDRKIRELQAATITL